MKAARYYGIHDIRYEQIDKPACGADEALIRVAYAGICGSDLHIYNKGMFMENIPETMGHEFSGVIEEVGADVTDFQPGDRVIANPMVTCGSCEGCRMGSPNTCENLGFIGEVRQGAFAEYIAMPQDTLIRVPEGTDLRKLALAEPLAVALHICRMAELNENDEAAVIGAGPIGLLTILAAKKLYNVRSITAVDLSEVRLELASSIGADRAVTALQEGEKFPKVVEAAGQPVTFQAAVDHVLPNGALYVVSIFEKDFVFDINTLVSFQIRLQGCNVYTREDLEQAAAVLADGSIDVEPLISAQFDLTECADAFRLVSGPDKSVAKVLFCMQQD